MTATPPPVDRRASTPSPPTDGFTEAEKAASVLIGYTMGAVVVLPFDRVKSLMQVDEVARKHGALGLAARILRTEGVRGLYRGGGVHMMIAPYTTFYYLLYDGIQARGRALTASPASPDGHHLVPLGTALAFFPPPHPRLRGARISHWQKVRVRGAYASLFLRNGPVDTDKTFVHCIHGGSSIPPAACPPPPEHNPRATVHVAPLLNPRPSHA